MQYAHGRSTQTRVPPLSAPASTSDLSTGHTTGPAQAQPKWNVPKNDSTRSSLWKLRTPRLEYSGQEDSPTLTSRNYNYRGDSPETPGSDPPAGWSGANPERAIQPEEYTRADSGNAHIDGIHDRVEKVLYRLANAPWRCRVYVRRHGPQHLYHRLSTQDHHEWPTPGWLQRRPSTGRSCCSYSGTSSVR